MRPLYWVLSAVVIVACSFLSVTTTPVPATLTPAPTKTIIPVPIEPSIAASTATLEPIALVGPPMEVGSMWPYVDGSVLVAVPGGPFVMGHGGSDNPEHTVTLSDFWIYQGKVTNQQYALCVKDGKCRPPDAVDDYTFNDLTHATDPVVGVDYEQAADYCAFVNGRLPTEAEWEKTARGPDGNLYPWGSNAPVCNVLNFNNCIGKLTRTTAYPDGQSYYHALDMEGNAFEWVSDWYDALYYKNSAANDPTGPEKGRAHSVRSASYKSKPDEIPSSTRRFEFPNTHQRDLSFRCVVNNPTYFAPSCTALGSIPASGEPDCPRVSIGLTEVCQQGKVTVVIIDDHSPDPSATLSGIAGNCAPVLVTAGSFPQIYDCTRDTTVTVTTACNYGPGPVTCAPHYTLNTTTGDCEWSGLITPGQACLPGSKFNSSQQCCVQPPDRYPACPLGSVLGASGGLPACVPDGSAINAPTDSEYIHVQNPATCTGIMVKGTPVTPGASTPGASTQQAPTNEPPTSVPPTEACTLSPASCRSQCPYGGVFVPSACTCVCYKG